MAAPASDLLESQGPQQSNQVGESHVVDVAATNPPKEPGYLHRNESTSGV